MPTHRYIIAELAANGFGSPGELAETRVDLVIDAYDFHKFKVKHEVQSWKIARDKEK